MGVKGLLAEIERHQDTLLRQFDLVEVVGERKKIELFIDYYAWQFAMFETMWAIMEEQNICTDCLKIIGAEYKALDTAVERFARSFGELGIHLVFFIDSSKNAFSAHKYESWLNRHHNEVERIQRIIDNCRNRTFLSIDKRDHIRPVLIECQILETLRRNGCELIQCLEYEADLVIAKEFSKRIPFAVVSNDMDFAIFKVDFIHINYFDMGNVLFNVCKTGTPITALKVAVLPSCSIGNFYHLENYDQLVDLAIASGNDHTREFLIQNGRLNLPSSLRELARGIRREGNLEGLLRCYGIAVKFYLDKPAVILIQNRKFNTMVETARQFYYFAQENSLNHLSDLGSCIVAGARKGDYPACFFSIHHGMYWYRMMLEDPGYSSDETMAPFRALIGGMLTDKATNKITEFGRTAQSTFIQTEVNINKQHLPPVHCIDASNTSTNLILFAKIATHMDRKYMFDYFKFYGMKTGFLCYVLRYMLVLNFQQNLRLQIDEFVPLVSAVFTDVDAHTYHKLPKSVLLPSARCVTLVNNLMLVYRYLYMFLASMLSLRRFFPQPRDFASGAVCTVFYYVCEQKRCQILEEQQLTILNDAQNAVHKMKGAIARIVEGMFSIDDVSKVLQPKDKK